MEDFIIFEIKTVLTWIISNILILSVIWTYWLLITVDYFKSSVNSLDTPPIAVNDAKNLLETHK